MVRYYVEMQCLIRRLHNNVGEMTFVYYPWCTQHAHRLQGGGDPLTDGVVGDGPVDRVRAVQVHPPVVLGAVYGHTVLLYTRNNLIFSRAVNGTLRSLINGYPC